MKRIVFALLCLFAAGSAAAQTYACQFIQTAGMDKDPKGSWKATEFKVLEPFFLTMTDGVIDSQSLSQPPTMMHRSDTKCSKLNVEHPVMGLIQWCSSGINFLSFSEKTLNGALSKTFGAIQSASDNDVDSVTVSRFKCQKVR